MLGRGKLVLGSLLTGSMDARRTNPAKQNVKYQLQPPPCISLVGAVGMQKQPGCSGLGWGVAWAASGEHPRVLVLWGSTAPRLVPGAPTPGLCRKYGEMPPGSRTLPSVEEPEGVEGARRKFRLGSDPVKDL